MYDKDQRLIEERKQAQNDRRQRYDKNALQHRVIKNMETIMIGCLEEIENHFGHLWGHDKDDYTKEEQDFYLIWQELRESILERGNIKILQTEKEVDKYSVSKKKYSYKFNLKDKK